MKHLNTIPGSIDAAILGYLGEPAEPDGEASLATVPTPELDATILEVLRESPRLGRDSGDDLFADIDPDPDLGKITPTARDRALMSRRFYQLTQPATVTASQ